EARGLSHRRSYLHRAPGRLCRRDRRVYPGAWVLIRHARVMDGFATDRCPSAGGHSPAAWRLSASDSGIAANAIAWVLALPVIYVAAPTANPTTLEVARRGLPGGSGAGLLLRAAQYPFSRALIEDHVGTRVSSPESEP